MPNEGLIIKNKEQLLQQVKTDNLLQAEAFTQGYLAREPEAYEIKINKRAGNSKYIPVSMVENKLDEIFFGMWQTMDFKTQVVANEIIGSIQLSVFHPITQVWITRTGAAAVMIQMISKEKGGDGDITNVRNKISNTLVKDYPHLKAECVKNAARSLGKWFGRDLNRDMEMTGYYEPIYTNEIENKVLITDIREKLRNCSSTEDLQLLWDSLEPEEQTDLIKRMFTQRKIEIQTKI